jgi:hypothetical protein
MDLASHQPRSRCRPAVIRAFLRLLVLGTLPFPAAAALAATPLGSEAFIPFNPPVGSALIDDGIVGADAVEMFDPVARAQLLARDTPRSWCGTYQSFDTAQVVSVQLELSTLEPMGQMVVLRGQFSAAGVTTPVQGNLNAESDQLDLLLLASAQPAGLDFGGQFSGLQGLQLSGWQANRLTNQGGRLELRPSCGAAPVAVPAAAPVRGMW